MDTCLKCHGWKEQEFHPLNYKTRPCTAGINCQKGQDCPYYHSGKDKRTPGNKNVIALPQQKEEQLSEKEQKLELPQNLTQIENIFPSKVCITCLVNKEDTNTLQNSSELQQISNQLPPLRKHAYSYAENEEKMKVRKFSTNDEQIKPKPINRSPSVDNVVQLNGEVKTNGVRKNSIEKQIENFTIKHNLTQYLQQILKLDINLEDLIKKDSIRLSELSEDIRSQIFKAIAEEREELKQSEELIDEIEIFTGHFIYYREKTKFGAQSLQSLS